MSSAAITAPEAKEVPKPELPYAEGEFRKHFWSTFSANNAAAILLDPRPSFTGYKDILLAALLAWTVQPYDRPFRQMVTVAAVAKTLHDAETWAHKRNASPLLRDFTARYSKLGGLFLSELYYGVGGINAIYKAPSRDLMRKKLISSSRAIQNAAEVMRILHSFETLNLRRDRKSLTSARAVIEKIWAHYSICYSGRNFTPYEERSLNEVWGTHDISAPYIYGAAHTETSAQTTLLMDLVSGKLVYRSTAPWVAVWLKRSAYALTLLADMPMSDLFQRAVRHAPSSPSEIIPLSGLTSVEENVIKTMFSI